jgi:hypothetical protein
MADQQELAARVVDTLNRFVGALHAVRAPDGVGLPALRDRQ